MNLSRDARHRVRAVALMVSLAAGAIIRGDGGMPAGFTEEVVAGGLALPVAFAHLPDGRILIAEKEGLVRLVKNGVLQTAPFIDLRARVNDYWDRGLSGLAVHPNFSSNGFVYLYYVRENNAADYTGPKTARLTRVTAVGDTAALSTEKIILGSQGGAGCAGLAATADCIPADSPSHVGGGLHIEPDGTIYLSTGDASSFQVVDPLALRVQNLDSLAGKLLRVTGAGRGLSTNPFWTGSATANRSKVLAYGFRNAFRLARHPSNGSIYVGDVGWDTFEEIDVVTAAGGNYGWPCYEGADQQPGYAALAECQALYARGPSAVVAPLLSIPRPGKSGAIVVGTFASDRVYPEAYHDALFFADYAQGTMSYLHVDSSDKIVGSVLPFHSQAGGPVDIHVGPEGKLYYLDILSGELRRINWSPPTGMTTQYVSDMQWNVVANGWGPPERDRSNGEQGTGDGRTLTINGRAYADGIGVHAYSEIEFSLGGSCTTFSSDIGIDDEVGDRGSVVFQVWADGVKRYDSGVVTGTTAALRIDVDVAGRHQLVLVVTDAGDGVNYDHADWADARLACAASGGGSLLAPPVSLPAGVNTHSVAAVDLNADGALDLVAANAGASTASVWTGNGDGTFNARTEFPTGLTPKQITAADLNRDGIPDLVSANQDAGTISVLLGTGAAAFRAPVHYTACAGAHESAAGDFNRDGSPDLILACWGGSIVHVFIGRGDGTFRAAVAYPAGSNPHSVVVDDFNRDGIADAVIANHGSADISVLRGRGDGTFLAQVRYAVGSGPHSIRKGDIDGDGVVDVAVANDGSDTASILLGIGDGTFEPAVHYPVGDVPKGVALVDVDGDDILDLMTANTAGSYPTCCQPGGDTISVLIGAGDGAFGPATTYRTGLTPFSIGTGDLDGDGDLDVLTANWHSNDVTILENLSSDGGGTPAPVQITGVSSSGITTTAATISWTTSEPADSRVEYGTSTAYGTTTPVDPALVTSHQVTLTGLTAGTQYHYRVRSAAADGEVATSSNFTFTTATTGGGTGVTYVSDLTWVSMTNGWGPVERDRSNGESGAGDGAVLRINGVSYAKGLGTHALSDVRYTIPAGCTQFRATAGVDDEVGANGSVTFTVFGDAVSLFTSSTVTGSGGPVDIAVDVTGRTQLRLVVGNGGDTIDYDHADWADARFVCGTTPPTPSTRYLSDLTWVSMTNGWGPAERDQSNGESGSGDGLPLRVNGVTYQKGLGVHALSDIRYAIPNGCTHFRATVGVDDEVGANGSVTFTVLGDTVTLFTSATATGTGAPIDINVDISGRSQIGLVVGNGGNDINYDHADWADARFVCGSGGGNAFPTADITSPASTYQYKVGDVVTLTGTGTDPEDGTLSGSRLQWNVILHHCPGDCHTHPFVQATGASSSFTVPDHGDDNFFEVVLTATDSQGQSSSDTVLINPQTVDITLTTSPGGLQVVYGGTAGTAPMVRRAVVGSTHTISVPSPQNGLVFKSWSDGGGQQHNIVIPATNATWTATFGAP